MRFRMIGEYMSCQCIKQLLHNINHKADEAQHNSHQYKAKRIGAFPESVKYILHASLKSAADVKHKLCRANLKPKRNYDSHRQQKHSKHGAT